MKRFWRCLVRWNNRRRRGLDFAILAPIIRSKARNAQAAAIAAAVHMDLDPAWSDATHEEMGAFMRACSPGGPYDP